MNTSYDDIFTCFLENCRIDTTKLPETNERKYNMIHNACRHYKNKMDYEEDVTWDDTTEMLNKQLDDDKLLILAFCMKLVYHENALTEFTDIYSVFQKELGFKNYREQVQIRENNIIRTEDKITELINNMQNSIL